MTETRARAFAHGLQIREFETLWDVDVPSDLLRLQALWATSPCARFCDPSPGASTGPSVTA
ncbi:MAG: hypothetical protein OEM00_11455 [Burkholderiaceae bacterium]|nr:hypothetical protein [Burkholderiaceae bacterium]